jgi:hypothetical protein
MKSIVVLAIAGLAIVTSERTVNAELFGDRETSLTVFGGWIDKDDTKVAPGIGFTHFPSRQWGWGVMTHWENYDGSLFDNVSGEGYFRFPLRGLSLAPYAVGAVGYSFETDEFFEAVGGGLEWRFDRKWGIFGDARWQFNNDTDDGIAFRVGVRMLF